MCLGNFKIERDKYNWILREKRIPKANHHMTKSTEPKFVDIGYYGKIEHLVNRLLNEELLQSDINTLVDIKTALFRIENELKNDIKKFMEVRNESDTGTTKD